MLGLALAALTVLSGCGVGLSNAPASDPFGPPPGTSPAPAAPSSTPTRAASRPAPAPRAEPSPTPGRPAKASPRPSASSKPWVGTFHGHKINVPRGHGAHVSFTFDDGPSPRFTPQVLALLAQHDTPAVFCLIGQQARAYPKLVRTEVKAGHALCDHSRDHDLTMNRRGQGYVTREVGDGLSAIQHASPGTPVRFYRQPGGTWSPKVVHAMHQHDLTPLRWTDDPRDWSRPGSEAIVRRVVDQLEPGAVILMHDGGGDRTQTVEALRWLLDALAQAGWEFVLAPEQHLSDKQAARPQ